MQRSVTIRAFIRLILQAATTVLMSSGVASAADAIVLQASEPQTIYYTTNGTAPTAPTSNITATSTAAAIVTFSLVPNAGKGTSYKKPEKLKIHESKREFEKHVKEKHGKRFKVATFNISQTENGLEGYIDVIENKDASILQLGDICTAEERAKRIAIMREFVANNPEMLGITENEELRERGLEKGYCDHLYFDRYVNGYESPGVYHLIFRPHYNYSIYTVLTPISPEMYSAAQQKSLTEEEIAAIVYNDMNIVVPDKKGGKPNDTPQKLPKLEMRKYLRNSEPYAIWEVRGRYVYEINAVTGEIVHKQLNRK